MEEFKIDNPDHDKGSRVIPGSDSWLGGPEVEETQRNKSLERDQFGYLPEGVGLDGAKFEVPIPRDNLFEKEEMIAEAEVVPEDVEGVAKMMLPIVKISISRGVEDGWDNEANSPTKIFIEREGADLEKAVKERMPKRKEECMVYELIKNEIPAQNERERAVRDALIKRASQYCPN